jgi:hypothetical protein
MVLLEETPRPGESVADCVFPDIFTYLSAPTGNIVSRPYLNCCLYSVGEPSSLRFSIELGSHTSLRSPESLQTRRASQLSHSHHAMATRQAIPRVSRQIKHDALMMEGAGAKPDDIVKTLPLSTSTFNRSKRKLKATGDIEGGLQKHSPKGKLDQGMKDVRFFVRSSSNYRGSFENGF